MARLAPNQPERPREWRRRVSIAARVKTGTDWADGHILNISSRGMLLQHSRPIAIGSYIEVRNDGRAVSATVVWREGSRAGLTCAQRIDLGDWIAAWEEQSGARCGSGSVAATVDRRAFPRTHDQSRGLARKLEFIAIAAIAVLIAVSVASLAASVLFRPFAAISTVLGN